jgi:hypothetical protein
MIELLSGRWSVMGLDVGRESSNPFVQSHTRHRREYASVPVSLSR